MAMNSYFLRTVVLTSCFGEQMALNCCQWNHVLRASGGFVAIHYNNMYVSPDNHIIYCGPELSGKMYCMHK